MSKKSVLHEHLWHENPLRRFIVPQMAASYRPLAAHAELRSPKSSEKSPGAAFLQSIALLLLQRIGSSSPSSVDVGHVPLHGDRQPSPSTRLSGSLHVLRLAWPTPCQRTRPTWPRRSCSSRHCGVDSVGPAISSKTAVYINALCRENLRNLWHTRRDVGGQ